ncbi:4Fe-4S dicluster domain-containing protein [Desulfovibrio subterraneus]|jgi:ferredoxin|uniref:mercury methylation ferredoxin HgcB n=1 Tax=Desulfovibrio subterraneus TaxID=2718620 RepID=UPI0022B8A07D|nr:mercury methylation ferredoxin HgcB [Desulfovibrio subterraneus]WBF67295.1 4Fe-4S dicluster domain-containing protein [Desulfovibrio subterraneus]
MKDFRYIDGVASIALEAKTCVGCGVCVQVCPHQVFTVQKGKAVFADRNACIECGACARNCPVDAILVTPGVGCASLMIKRWLHEKGIPVRLGGGTGCC